MSLLSKKAICTKFSISPATVDRMRKKGMPSYKVGTKVIFDPEEVEKWIKEDKSNEPR